MPNSKKDEAALKKKLANLKGRDIVILTSGGIGDQVNFEPVVRYMLETSCKNDLIRIVTSYGEIFEHLKVETYDASKPCLALNTTIVMEPYPVNRIGPIDYQSSHFTDFASVNLLRRTLPLAYKRPKLPVSKSDLKKLDLDFEKLVVIHAGHTWSSRTFPQEIWQSYVDILRSEGYKVVVIGKTFEVETVESPDHKVRKGALKLQADYDLIDKLSFRETCALLSKANVLLTNDSAPLHMAFAYDNWIGCVATARHPDYLFSWRNNSQYWKAQALEEHKAYANEYAYDPMIQTGKDTANLDPQVILKACPDCSKILKFVKLAFDQI